MNVGLQKTSLINYPKRLAAAVFLPGCNLRCPYCYNPELVTASVYKGPVRKANTSGGNEYVPIEAVYSHIEKRKNVLSGLVISGGEALLSPVLSELIMRAKKAGLAVKLDTNGLLPDSLAALLADPLLCPDMIALDIKTNPARYNELHPCQSGTCTETESEQALRKTLALLRRHEVFPHPVNIEYRTVLVPPLIGATEIVSISEELPSSAEWFLSPFLAGNCLNPEWNAIRPYTQAETEKLLQLAQSKIPRTRLR